MASDSSPWRCIRREARGAKAEATLRQITSTLARLFWFAVILVFSVIRIALAAALSLIAPVVLPLLVLLSGGGLVIAGAFACTGHWHHALMAGWACLICTGMLIVFTGLVQLVNPYAFSVPVRIINSDPE